MKIPDYLKQRADNDGNSIWIRICPKCNREVIHKNFCSAKNCHKQKRLCSSCGNWTANTIPNDPRIRKMALKVSAAMKKLRQTEAPWNKGLTKETNDLLKQMGENHIGFKHSEETKRMIGKFSEKFWKDPEYRKMVTEAANKNRNVPKWRSTMEKLEYFTPLEQKSDWERYKQLVWYHTNQNDLSVLPNYEKRARIEIFGSYSLDHRFSLAKGFKEEIDPKIMGSVHNLEFIPAKENDSKKTKCSVTKEELIKLYANGKNQV